METDRELLARYAASGDEAAIAEIIHRHGGAVYRACLRSLGDAHEAEDASQAVFMVLVRKAGSLGRRGDLAAWLHEVARKTALQAARNRARRTRRQEEAAVAKAAEGLGRPAGAGQSAVLGLLDRELAALPVNQRQAVVLRYLEARPEQEAAALAGIPQGTLSQRASRGLARLRERLEARGCTLSGAALVGLLEAESLAALPANLLPSIVTASQAAGGGAVLAHGAAGALMKEVLGAMFWTKVKLVAAVLGAAVLAGGGGTVAVRHLAAGEPASEKSVTLQPSPRAAALPANQWVLMKGPESGVQILSWDEIRYAPELDGVLFYGAYRSYTSENQNAIWLYRFRENRWRLLHINMFFNRDEMCSDGGHTGGRMAYDHANRVMVHQGLVSMTCNDRYRTWAFDPSAMVGWDANPQGQTPTLQLEAVADYVPEMKASFMYRTDRGAWAYDFPANQWKQLAPAGGGPEAMTDGVYDAKHKRVLAFGGTTSLRKPIKLFNNLWAFDIAAKTWQKLDAKNPPPGRVQPQMAISTADDVLLLAGGMAGVNEQETAMWLNDTWTLDLESLQWEQMALPKPAPPTNHSNHMAYDPVNDVFLLLSVVSGSYSSNTYALRYEGKKPVKPQPPAVTPPPVYDLKALPKPEGEWAALGNGAVSAVQGWAFRPSLAANGNELLLAFGEYPDFGKSLELSCDVYAFKYAGGQWTKLGKEVSDPGIHSQAPAAAFDSTGKPVVAYQAIRPWVPAAINVRRFDGEWKPVGSFKLPETAFVAGLPALAGGSGALAVAWQHSPNNAGRLVAYVSENSGEAWPLVGGGAALNVNDPATTNTKGQLVSLVRDGQGRLVVAWQEQTAGTGPIGHGGNNATPERIHVRRLEGGKWTELAKELPAAAPQARQVGYSMTLHDGEPAVAVCEGLRGEHASLWVYLWKGGQWQKLGDGPLNVLGAEGGALKPGTVSDGKNLYVAWPEFLINRPPLLFVKKWDGVKWTLLGGPLNEMPGKGSAHTPVMAMLAGKPVVAWTEHDFNSDRLRQLFVKALR